MLKCLPDQPRRHLVFLSQQRLHRRWALEKRRYYGGHRAGEGDVYRCAHSSTQSLTNVGGTLFFKPSDPTYSYELWKSYRTTAGTGLAKSFCGSIMKFAWSYTQYAGVWNRGFANGTRLCPELAAFSIPKDTKCQSSNIGICLLEHFTRLYAKPWLAARTFSSTRLSFALVLSVVCLESCCISPISVLNIRVNYNSSRKSCEFTKIPLNSDPEFECIWFVILMKSQFIHTITWEVTGIFSNSRTYINSNRVPLQLT